jgi:diacylglycerol kinase family enzyme
VLARLASGRAERSPLTHMTRGRTVDVKLGAPLTIELDGGARGGTKRIKASVEPAAISVCVPDPTVPA